MRVMRLSLSLLCVMGWLSTAVDGLLRPTRAVSAPSAVQAALDSSSAAPLVWCLSRLSRELVAVVDDCESLPLELVSGRNVLVVSAAFWFLQRAAALQALLR
jgi:hypothetical protein